VAVEEDEVDADDPVLEEELFHARDSSRNSRPSCPLFLRSVAGAGDGARPSATDDERRPKTG
jgi:hypothetical protein